MESWIGETAAAVGGGIVSTVLAWLFGRSESAAERRKQEIVQVALKAVEDSEKFALAGEQTLINQQIKDDVAVVRRTVNGIDAKLDTLLFSGLLPIKKRD